MIREDFLLPSYLLAGEVVGPHSDPSRVATKC